MRDFMALQQAEKGEDPIRDKLPVVLREVDYYDSKQY